jgi:hypothetical protein
MSTQEPVHRERCAELVADPRRFGPLPPTLSPSEDLTRCGKPVSAQVARLLSRAQDQATPCQQSDPPDAGAARSLVQLARRVDHGKASSAFTPSSKAKTPNLSLVKTSNSDVLVMKAT